MLEQAYRYQHDVAPRSCLRAGSLQGSLCDIFANESRWQGLLQLFTVVNQLGGILRAMRDSLELSGGVFVHFVRSVLIHESILT